jgi:hypothetical protein
MCNKKLKTMKKIIIILFSGLAFLLTGCATSYHLQPIEQTKNMDLLFSCGKPVALSHLAKSTVALYGVKGTGKELELHILIRNDGNNPRVNIFPEKIKVHELNSEGRQSEVKVYSAEEYLKRLRKAETWSLVLLSVGNAATACQAGYSYSTTNSSSYGITNGSNGVAVMESSNAISTTTIYNPGKVAEINAINRQQFYQTAQMYSNIYDTTEKGLLKTVTLFPKQEVEGLVMVKLNNSSPQKIVIEVPVGFEVHKFIFNLLGDVA